MSSYELITVEKLTKQLSSYEPETEITFGSSTYSKRPLIFLRFKRYAEDVLLIELYEDVETGESHRPTPEHVDRITVGEIREQLSAYRPSDKIDFGCTIDGVLLELENVTNVVSFNFKQSEPPEGRYVLTRST
ncbi:hypothetical protein H206_00438 [Candidatus Electrothrix aarhusensis]|uniref:Uncharacterized protein n=1 Tax=Candidatus Electrothrix aarhusensis TaxID=1859131 RepID=A0A444IZ95_9BACT|nr:hypothetical protein H206_00438 [Candidatus Electrothrix aarhusensis]